MKIEKKSYPIEEIVIKPPSKSIYINVKEIYKYRHLLWNLVKRDIRIQFDQMYLGVLWATARPLLMVTVFTLFKKLSSANLYVSISYEIYVYSGLILWFYFLETTTSTSKALQKNANLITKVYYPKLINLFVPIIGGLYSLGVAAFPLFCMMVWQGIYPGWKIILLPLVVLQCMLFVLAVGTLFASLSLETKDFDKLLNQILYIGLYVSPVIFAPELIPAKGRVIYFLNPMVGTLLAFRACLFDGFPFPVWQWLYSVVATLILLAISLIIYQRLEAYIADKL